MQTVCKVAPPAIGDSPHTWLVMELIRGESIRELPARGPLPMKKVLANGTGTAEGQLRTPLRPFPG